MRYLLMSEKEQIDSIYSARPGIRGKVMAFRPFNAYCPRHGAACSLRAIRTTRTSRYADINYPNVLLCEQSITETICRGIQFKCKTPRQTFFANIISNNIAFYCIVLSNNIAIILLHDTYIDIREMQIFSPSISIHKVYKK